jgi:hypothetical protein
LGFIFRLLLAIIAFQIIGGLIRSVRRRGQQSKRREARGPDGSADPVQPDEYSDLTPYEIEDADFEELPKREE